MRPATALFTLILTFMAVSGCQIAKGGDAAAGDGLLMLSEVKLAGDAFVSELSRSPNRTPNLAKRYNAIASTVNDLIEANTDAIKTASGDAFAQVRIGLPEELRDLYVGQMLILRSELAAQPAATAGLETVKFLPEFLTARAIEIAFDIGGSSGQALTNLFFEQAKAAKLADADQYVSRLEQFKLILVDVSKVTAAKQAGEDQAGRG